MPETITTAGDRPHTVAVALRGQSLYLRWWDSDKGKPRWHALGHDDEDRARRQARKLAAAFEEGDADRLLDPPTLDDIFRLYRKHRTPEKGERQHKADDRRIELFTRVFGPDKEPDSISSAAWERFVDQRQSGVIDARGNPVPKGDRRPVQSGTVGEDLRFLNAVMRWAVTWKTEDGFLLDENPLRGFSVPSTDSPRRPVATEERYRASLEVADEVHPYLTTLLVLANETGQRIGAIRQLEYHDLRLDRDDPAIRWRAELQKNDVEVVLPVTANAVDALRKHRAEFPGIGEAYVFPAPKVEEKPLSRSVVNTWLQRAEDLAGLEPLDGALWHAYRRKFATELMAEANRSVVATLGNWRTTQTIDKCYNQPNEAQLKEALEGRKVLTG